MTVAVAALTVLLAAVTIVFAGVVRSLIRQHARERGLLVNQILHLSGRTWTPPPAEEWHSPTGDEPLVREWTPTPEQSRY